MYPNTVYLINDTNDFLYLRPPLFLFFRVMGCQSYRDRLTAREIVKVFFLLAEFMHPANIYDDEACRYHDEYEEYTRMVESLTLPR
jgi:hypothetical protein